MLSNIQITGLDLYTRGPRAQQLHSVEASFVRFISILHPASSFPEQEALCTEQTRKRLGQPAPGPAWFTTDALRFLVVGFAAPFCLHVSLHTERIDDLHNISIQMSRSRMDLQKLTNVDNSCIYCNSNRSNGVLRKSPKDTYNDRQGTAGPKRAQLPGSGS